MAESLVGAADTNERQYNIPLRADFVRWQWVCTVYPKNNRLRPRQFVSDDPGLARSQAYFHAREGRLVTEYETWDLKQVMVPIAV